MLPRLLRHKSMLFNFLTAVLHNQSHSEVTVLSNHVFGCVLTAIPIQGDDSPRDHQRHLPVQGPQACHGLLW